MTVKDSQALIHCCWDMPTTMEGKAEYWDALMDYLDVHKGHRLTYDPAAMPRGAPILGNLVCSTCQARLAADD